MFCLCKPDPCRTAGSKQRIFAFSPAQFFFQLCGFLHNGQICTHAGIVHVVHSQHTDCGKYFSNGIGARLQAEFLPQCNSHRRSNLHHNTLLRVVDGFPDFFFITLNGYGSGRTDCRTLSAVYTVRIRQLPVKGWAYHHVGSSVGKINSSDFLYFIAHSDAVSAENTLGRIPDNGQGRVVDRDFRLCIRKTDFRQSESSCQ